MRGDRIAFSHLLPVVDLALLVVLVFVPITLMSLHLYEASKGSDQVHIHTGQFDMTLPRDQIVPATIRIVTVAKAQTMMAINLPAVLLQALISLPSHTSPPSSWHPQALLLDTWQALVYPFFCLPSWWLVGCGLDGIVSRERLHWSLLLIGTLLSAICLALFLAFCFGVAASDRSDLVWTVKGLTGWTIAFAVLPIAWIMQSIRHRRPPPTSPAAFL
jgi:hypothetical protein